MATRALLGLFKEPASAAKAVIGLRQLGVKDEEITVMSTVPFEPEMLSRPKPKDGVMPIVLAGAALGILTAIFLTAGIYMLYPLDQGGQPLIPVPPSLIIVFEVAMLGTMWSAFFGFLLVNKLPLFGRPVYDIRVSQDDIGVAAEVDDQMASRAEDVLHKNDAHEIKYYERERVNVGAWMRLVAGLGVGLVVGAIITVLFFYDVLKIPFPTQMADQDSIAYLQGPRLAAPAAAIPIQGPVLIDGQPASEPLPPTADSLQRGQVLFSINCALCHGENGKGDGPVGDFFAQKPADLTSVVIQGLPNEAIFTVITYGFGAMPSIAENLQTSERWDVANHVKTLGNGGQ